MAQPQGSHSSVFLHNVRETMRDNHALHSAELEALRLQLLQQQEEMQALRRDLWKLWFTSLFDAVRRLFSC